jgi:Lon protease-like protein
MTRSPFDPAFEALPASLPIFPLSGALLLPGGKLPLNIFEPRYLAMTRDALAGDRLIGMVQPTELEAPGRAPAVYPIGCAGRIVSFSETEDGRYLITLAGLCRFRIRQELPGSSGYRRVEPDFTSFRADMVESSPGAEVDRERLLSSLKLYFKLHGISADWKAIAEAADDKLVTTLAMICPFADAEKQALLESPDLTERSRMMIALIELALLSRESGEAARH